jgi:AmiR/NasT family two-component response regulator
LTTSSNPKDIIACYESGVNSYIVKPMNINQLSDSVRTIVDYWFKVAVLPTAIDSPSFGSSSFATKNPI